ncbi:MAG TPA: hypothetical protein PKE64_03705 [Anaerolineae bacterium]|nr:hypothetical protein [Anaerolineae bacterium]
MTVTTQRRRQSQLTPSVQRRQHISKQIQAVPSSNVAPSLKASLVGGFGILILMLIGLIPPPENLPFVSLAFLVVPGFLVVCLATGLLAGIFAGEAVTNSHEGGKLGWMAGFWAGIFGGIVAMFLAAIGLLMENFGLNVASQFSTDLGSLGLSAGAIALTGRVVGALVVYGIIGSLVSGLLSSIGGMLYPKLTH